jgi:uncharacterized protein YceK
MIYWLRVGRAAALSVVAIILLSIYGCATVETISAVRDESPLVYSGTRLDLHAVFKHREHLLWLKRKFDIDPPNYPLADFPLSILLDTVIFPLTSSVALYEVVFD